MDGSCSAGADPEERMVVCISVYVSAACADACCLSERLDAVHFRPLSFVEVSPWRGEQVDFTVRNKDQGTGNYAQTRSKLVKNNSTVVLDI